MAATSTTTQVTCPMHHEGTGGHLNCGGELVDATFASFSATTAKVSPCSSLIAQGWKGPQAVLRRTELDRYVPAQTLVRHFEGLVWMAS